MKVIFNDVDGVLNNDVFKRNVGYGKMDPSNVANFNWLLQQAPDAKIVVSSDWRYGYGAQTLIKLKERWTLEGIDGGRIIGFTPMVSQSSSPYASRSSGDPIRGGEIAAWLRANQDNFDITSFVIIDDDDNAAWSLDERRWVQTCSTFGLRHEDCVEALRILQTPLAGGA